MGMGPTSECRYSMLKKVRGLTSTVCHLFFSFPSSSFSSPLAFFSSFYSLSFPLFVVINTCLATGDKPSARTNHAAAAIGKHVSIFLSSFLSFLLSFPSFLFNCKQL